MPLPFIPLIVGGASVAAGAVGIGKGVKAASDNSKAKSINSAAQTRVDNARKLLDARRDMVKSKLEGLGRQKLWIYEAQIQRFADALGQLKNVELTNSPNLEGLQNFKIDQNSISDLRRDCELAKELAGGVASGALAGGLMAFGAYGAATTLATASTGTAIATLSGAAATNATLAFFGGGALAAGGLGIAGGMAVLGGIVAGPALALAGFVMGNKAEANLNNAYSNLAKAEEISEELTTMRVACEAISDMAGNFSKTLDKLQELFAPQIETLLAIIRDEGTNYGTFKRQSKDCVAVAISTAQAVKALLDTPILEKNGALAEKARISLDGANKYLLTQGS